MLLAIDTILRDHGIALTSDVSYKHTYELTAIQSATGSVFSTPLDFFNANRDVLLVFIDGRYQSPTLDYAFEDGPVIRFETALSGETLSLISLKSVRVWKEAPNARDFENSSIRLKKLDIGILNKLISPEEKGRMERQLLGIRKSLDDLSKDFAAIELRFALADRVRAGSLIGDNFKTAAIGVTPLDASVTIEAVASGQSIVTVASGETGSTIPFRIGEEVSIFDNAGLQRRTIKAISGKTITFDQALTFVFKRGTVVCRSMGRGEQAGYNFLDWRDPVLSTLYQIQTYDVRYEMANVRRFVLWIQTKSGSCSVNVFKKQTGSAEVQVPVAIKQVADEMQAVVSSDDPATYIIRLTFNRTNPAIMPNYVRLLGGYET